MADYYYNWSNANKYYVPIPFLYLQDGRKCQRRFCISYQYPFAPPQL